MSKDNSLPYLSPELCGLAAAAELLGDQWVLLILREVFYGVTRFETMRSHTKMTKQTLANRLKKMTELDLLCKIPYQEEGSRERLQAFEGVVIAKRNRGLNSAFTVRKISHNVGVERVFQTYSPIVDSITVKRRGDVRRAKLYYLRNLSGRAARIREKLPLKKAD